MAVDNARLFHAVKEANRQKDEFLAMLAHELRNPLAAIRYAVALGQMSPGGLGRGNVRNHRSADGQSGPLDRRLARCVANQPRQGDAAAGARRTWPRSSTARRRRSGR